MSLYKRATDMALLYNVFINLMYVNLPILATTMGNLFCDRREQNKLRVVVRVVKYEHNRLVAF